jgi:hypothetical protein
MQFSIPPILVYYGRVDQALPVHAYFVVMIRNNLFICNRPKKFGFEATMKDSLRRQVEWLLLLSLSTLLVAVTASAVLVDNATVSLLEQKIRVEEESASNSKPTEYQPSGQFESLETPTATNLFDDLCRLHGNLLDSSVTSGHNQMDRSSRHGIDILHEIFDPSFGLVPYVSYTSKN